MMSIGPKPSLRLRDLLLPLLAAALVLFPGLGQTPFRRAEIYFADAARAMVERGDWIIPYFRGVPFFDKPVLTYWFLAASFEVFGFSSGAARLASSLATLLVIAATAWISWLLWKDRASALAAGWVLVATVPFMTFGSIAMSDMLLTLWTTLAMALGLLCYQSKRPPSFVILALAAVLGLGFLTKGPIALIIPGLGLLCILWQRRRLPVISLPTILISALVFAVFALGWFVVVFFRMGMEPINFFFVRENLQRFSGAVHDVGRPVWFYLATYLGQGAPWSFLLPLGAVQFLRRPSDGEAKILILWVLLVAGLLTLSHGKIDYYLVPLYPAASILVGRYLQIAVWTRGQRWFVAFLLGVVGIALILLPLPMMRVPLEWRPTGLAMAGVATVLVVAGLVCLAAIPRPRPAVVLKAFVLSVWLAFGVVSVFLLPSFFSAQPNEALVAAVSRERMLRPNLAVAAHEDPTQLHRDLLFHSRLVVEESSDLHALALSPKAYLILASPAEAATLKDTGKVREIGTYRYLPLRFFTLRGILTPPSPERLVLLANFDF
jgi:4-amino-4-deoxy-L-arabinose transferase-like glycosyltransferase